MTKTHDVPPDELVLIGRLNRPYGVHGEIHFHAVSETADWIFSLRDVQLYLVKEDKPPLPVRATLRRRQGGHHLVHLEGIDTPEAAAAYAGYGVAIHESNRPEAPEDEFYLDELPGLRVIDPRGNDIGHVARVVESRTNEFLEIQTGTETYLLPLEKSLIKKISLQENRIELKQDLHQ